MILLLSSLALADSITLDTGATIEGDLARYEFGGNCQLSVTEGDLAGVILIVPCHRVESFQRTSARRPVPIGIEVEAERQAAARAPAPASAARAEAPVAIAEGTAPLASAAPAALVDTSDVLVAEELSALAPEGPLSEPDAPAAEPAAPPPPPPLPLTTFGGVVDGQLQYDEPLFPEDAVTPIAPEPTAAPAAEPSAPETPVVPDAPAPAPAATSAADAPLTPPADGPRLAPRMDDPTTRVVRF